MKRLLFFIVGFVQMTNCVAQEKLTEHVYTLKNEISENATIEDFKLLEGNWTGSGLGGEVDELWMAPRAGQMNGIFRMEQDGELVFTEYMTILQDSISYLMKVKHFSPNFEGWEEKEEAVDFRFIKKENNRLYFSGLTAHRKDDSHLDIYVAFKHDDGSRTEELFAFKKK